MFMINLHLLQILVKFLFTFTCFFNHIKSVFNKIMYIVFNLIFLKIYALFNFFSININIVKLIYIFLF